MKKINLSCCQHLNTGYLDLAPTSLAQLEAIHLGSSNISINNINKLILAAPNMKKIYLYSCQHLNTGYLDLAPNSLAQLEEIHLNMSNISIYNLNILSQAAPKCYQRIKEVIRIKSLSNDEPPPNQQPDRPIYDHNHMRDLTPNTKQWKYKKLDTKNQGMIIMQLSAYMSKYEAHRELIPQIQDGICAHLSKYFTDHKLSEWDTFINLCLRWDPEQSIDPELKKHFDALISSIKSDSIDPLVVYLGDNVNFNNLLLTKKNMQLDNMTHRIAIDTKEDKILFYDPNYNGCKTSNDLYTDIVNSIGDIVGIVGSHPELLVSDVVINDSASFIEKGGLLMLSRASNYNKILEALKIEEISSIKSLDGILLRNTKGIPAWVVNLMHWNPDVRNLGRQLLKKFIALRPHNAELLLRNSMSSMQNEESSRLMVLNLLSELHLLQNDNPSPPIDALIQDLRVVTYSDDYRKLLQANSEQSHEIRSVLEYCQECLREPPEYCKRLIELDTNEKVQALQLQLQKQASRPVFYIEKAEDLICFAGFIHELSDNKGRLQKGPGGKLYEFLKENEHSKPILIIDYTKWPQEDIVAFNSLLDKTPMVDQLPLPENTSIIGLRNINNPNCYTGEDFYSRFTFRDKLPVFSDELELDSPWQEAEAADENSVVIDLFNSLDWKDVLCGRWLFNGDVLEYQPGKLDQAKSIILKNAPWDNQEFQHFWRQARSKQGFRYNNKIYHIPVDTKVIKGQDGYAWDDLKSSIINNAGDVPSDAFILNPACLNQLFEKYTVENKKLFMTRGYLASSEQQLIPIYLTHTISDDEWAQILTQCQELGKTLQVWCAPGVTVPQALDGVVQQNIRLSTKTDQIIISSDPDAALSIINQVQDRIVINVSECDAADLLEKLDVSIKEDDSLFEFDYTESALIQSLKQNKNVVLVGDFSQELQDKLSEYLAKRSHLQDPQGRVIVITQQTDAFQFVENRTTLEIDFASYNMSLFDEEEQQDLKSFASEPLSKLRARRDYLEVNSNAQSSDAAWNGLRYIASKNSTLSQEDLSNNESRKKAINDVLNCDGPQHVFISGLSGVGKSTFVKDVLCDPEHDSLYIDESHILDWLKDSSDKRKILFLDEANLSRNQWSAFEGLYYDPPSLLYKGQVYPLTKQHKVIFAGNPISYSNTRTLAKFFDHGHVVLFPPLSTEMIEQEILSKTWSLDEYRNNVALNQKILATYQEICARSETEILISPRELEMIVLMIEQGMRNGEDDVDLVADRVLEQFKSRALSLPRSIPQGVPSRKPLEDELNLLLDLRSWRKTNPSLNEKQLYGGLGGMIIEGAPGIGKSKLIFDSLVAKGLEKNRDFYYIPVGLGLEDKKALLLTAFHAGAIVIIEEINSAPMMEGYLNSLLMGKTLDGKRPDNPGFCVIGSQNPISMSGRRAMSEALKRRLLCSQCSDYTDSEIIEIITNKGIECDEAVEMVSAYNSTRESLQTKGYQLTFRDLIEKVVEPILKSREATHNKLMREELEADSVDVEQHTHFFKSQLNKLNEHNSELTPEDVKKFNP